MAKHKLHLELSKEVLNVKMLVIEGINCLNAVKPTGSGWVCDLPQLEVGSDADVDVFTFVEGLPNTKPTMSVTIDKQAADDFSGQFNSKGNTFFNEAVKVKVKA